jgi:hypothetical protein
LCGQVPGGLRWCSRSLWAVTLLARPPRSVLGLVTCAAPVTAGMGQLSRPLPRSAGSNRRIGRGRAGSAVPAPAGRRPGGLCHRREPRRQGQPSRR